MISARPSRIFIDKPIDPSPVQIRISDVIIWIRYDYFLIFFIQYIPQEIN
jgi:hypothetical protein